jgi:hypothetical protein
VYPARGSPKKIGPPEVEADEGPVEKGLFLKGDVGDEVNCVDEGERGGSEWFVGRSVI